MLGRRTGGGCLPLPGSMSSLSEPAVTVTVTARDATRITRCNARQIGLRTQAPVLLRSLQSSPSHRTHLPPLPPPSLYGR